MNLRLLKQCMNHRSLLPLWKIVDAQSVRVYILFLSIGTIVPIVFFAEHLFFVTLGWLALEIFFMNANRASSFNTFIGSYGILNIVLGHMIVAVLTQQSFIVVAVDAFGFVFFLRMAGQNLLFFKQQYPRGLGTRVSECIDTSLI